jgi:Xaa-Pro aminopeptidase
MYAERRQTLRQLVTQAQPEAVVLVTTGFENDRLTYRPESSFYYLTGSTEPAAVLCLYPDGRELLYLPRLSVDRAIWGQVQDPYSLGLEIKYLGATVSGFTFPATIGASWYSTLLEDLTGSTLALPNDSHPLYLLLQEEFSTLPLDPYLAILRRSKDSTEIATLTQACQLTVDAHRLAAQVIAPGVTEREVQAVIEASFIRAGATTAFPSIVASGPRTTILHSKPGAARLQAGELVIVDIGAEYQYYTADLARTYPVSGYFTARQYEIYQAVLATQQYVESCVQVGMYLYHATQPNRSLHHLALAFLSQLGFPPFPHALGHSVGLDVHDLDNGAPLEAGSVFTLEPGIYLPSEGVGVRLEDLYVLESGGLRCLSANLPNALT